MIVTYLVNGFLMIQLRDADIVSHLMIWLFLICFRFRVDNLRQLVLILHHFHLIHNFEKRR